MKSPLQIKQLDQKLAEYTSVKNIAMPVNGWIKAIRSSLGMSLEQLGKKLGVTKQNIQSIEKREKDGKITIQTLRETAEALDMKLIYALVPKDGSLEKLIEKRAAALAKEIVMRASQTMALENQEIAKERILKAINERKKQIIETNPKILWD